MTTGVILKNLQKLSGGYLAKINFIVQWITMKLLLKIINLLLLSGKHLEWIYKRLSWFPLKNNVLLLATVFKSFRVISENSFKLARVYCLSSPGYIWDAMLRLKGINLKIISYIENYQFIESVIKSGISMIFKDYS